MKEKSADVNAQLSLKSYRVRTDIVHVTDPEVEQAEGWEKGGGGQVPPEQGKTFVNYGEEDQMEIVGYEPHKVKTAVTWIGMVLTVGLLRLVFFWKPEWMLWCTHSRCHLRRAKKVLLRDQYQQLFVAIVQEMDLQIPSSSDVDIRDPKSTLDGVSLASSMADFSGHIWYFVTKKVMYLWNVQTETFDKLRGFDYNQTCSFFHKTQPLTLSEQEHRRKLYGENVIDVHVDSIGKLLFTQALNPFYIFQLFSCILWYFDVYYYYASAIVVMSVTSLTAEIYQTRTMQRALKSTISASEVIPVCRQNDEYEEVMTEVLVPGDIIEIPRHGCTMQCDAVLITGNCIVNESMLTGESVPVTKTPLPNPEMLRNQPTVPYLMKEHGRHTLFCGTKVIQTRYYGKQKVKAIVIRTGFATAKGELVRSIMFPKPIDFRFARDTYKFLGVLSGIASIGMIYTLVVMTLDGTPGGDIAKRMLDLITIVIPPALPAAMTIGTVYAQKRLKKAGIYCITPKSIAVSGTINTFCFDKTGTLTEDGLDMWGVVPVSEGSFHPEEKDIPNLGRDPMMIAMAACHSLTIIEGELTGDPLDLRMFESTGWVLEEPGEDTTKFDVFMPTLVRPKTPDLVQTSQNFGSTENIPFEVGILRQFTFSSKLQRMSVIARTLTKAHFDLYAKGSPEMIVSLSKPETVPKDFHDVLMTYTQKGYRVLALAWKPLKKLNYVKVQRAQREQMECDLIFLGLLVMENRLKPQTTAIIKQLKAAHIRTIMVTGDNMLTALSVARDCDIIKPRDKAILVQVVPPVDGQQPYIEWNYAEDINTDVKEVMTRKLMDATTIVQMDLTKRVHFALTGRSWHQIRQYFPELIHKLVVRGTVFARFSPDQKQQLVECLQELGYYVGMCGDGANDCGALKTAHTGISLSEAEASVASPFTSKTPDISCVPTTIREGRAALVTTFGIFKYMAGYSLTQFLSVCMLYWVGSNLSDFTFLYIDLFIITTLGATFGFTGAYPELVPTPPPIKLLSFTPIFSCVIHLIIIAAFQVGTWYLVKAQPWFEEREAISDKEYECYELSALFGISSFQYVTLAVIFSKAAPYRKTLFSNILFLVNVIVLTALNVWVVVYPTDGLAGFLELVQFPSLPFRGMLVGLAIGNFFICFLVEVYVLESDFVRSTCHNAIEHRTNNKSMKYLAIEEELNATPDWPPVSESTYSLADLMRLENSPLHSPDGITSNAFVEDDDGEDDVSQSHSLHSKRKRHRTKSTTSTVSGSGSSSLPDQAPCRHKTKRGELRLPSSDTDPTNKDWNQIGYDDSLPILQHIPDSPRSPTFPLLVGLPESHRSPSSQAGSMQQLHLQGSVVHTEQHPVSVLPSPKQLPTETRL